MSDFFPLNRNKVIGVDFSISQGIFVFPLRRLEWLLLREALNGHVRYRGVLFKASRKNKFGLVG